MLIIPAEENENDAVIVVHFRLASIPRAVHYKLTRSNSLIVKGNAHIQYSSRSSFKKTRAILHDLKNFEDNLCVGLMQHKKYTALE